MFGVSFLEIAVIGLIALIVVGPQKLPGMMRTAGEWVGKLRRMTSDMRKQTGIDDILREEGIDGVAELRTLLRGGGLRNAAFGLGHQNHHSTGRGAMHYTEAPDPLLEFPVEGVDAAGTLPDDLFAEDSKLELPSSTNSSSESASPEDDLLQAESASHAENAQLTAPATGTATSSSPSVPYPSGNPDQQK